MSDLTLERVEIYRLVPWEKRPHFPKLIPDDDLPRWCRLCGHAHHGDCQEDAPNPAFRCHCPGECEHGKHPHYCGECNKVSVDAKGEPGEHA